MRSERCMAVPLMLYSFADSLRVPTFRRSWYFLRTDSLWYCRKRVSKSSDVQDHATSREQSQVQSDIAISAISGHQATSHDP